MKLPSLALIALLSSASAGGYNTRISGYAPGTDVVDHGNIDLDQAAMEVAIGEKTETGFAAGLAIYETGGNSKVSATMTLTVVLGSDISKGTILSGVGIDGFTVSGSASDTANEGDSSVSVKYAGGTCMSNGDTSRCFASSGTLTYGKNEYAYTSVVTSAGRTLKGFSTAVESKMSDEEQAKYFHDYYGEWDYADVLVQAAFSGTSTDFTNGNADFSDLSLVGREQLVKKMSVYMNVFMYVLHEFEAAVGKCVETTPYDNEAAIHAWDEGVAFYSGYLSGVAGLEVGNMVYALAEKRGGDFGTKVDNVSQVNIDLAELFARGRDQFDAAQCEDARRTLKKVKRIIYIPVIQGALKYAFESTYESIGITCEQVGGLLLDKTLPKGGYEDGFAPCCVNSKKKTFKYENEKMTCRDLTDKGRETTRKICSSVTKARKQCAKACKAC